MCQACIALSRNRYIVDPMCFALPALTDNRQRTTVNGQPTTNYPINDMNSRHGPTAARYCLHITRAICARCAMSCAAQVASS